ncbi:MAG TPA: hypothetical protein VMM77_00625 [Gemmatimonadaceae bacterium]|nr:hypothetical protein [Gemmatimonadaceae bacterium]
MNIRTPLLTAAFVATGTLVFWACSDNTIPGLAEVEGQPLHKADGKLPNAGFEVWIADQSDTRPGYGGQLLVYEGSDLMGNAAANAAPLARLDLGDATSALCQAATGRNPVRPHMLAFNAEGTHAILSFVASGHVVIFESHTRTPVACFETSVGSTGTRQAHAAFAAPDGSYILVANQNGKRLERINANFATNQFTPDPAATLDLATCITPSGAACEDPNLRPINWPICPVIDASSRYAFVTLRGGGLFVVDAKAPQMAIVAEYDSATVHGNGCGGIQVGDQMYINSGGSPVNVSGADPNHPLLNGFDVYRFPVTGFSSSNPPNVPAPELIFSKSGNADSHGVTATGGGRYVWVMDRHNDVVEVLEVASGQRVATVDLNGSLTSNAAPDLTDIAPSGNRVFVALRGPVPLSGDPHNATGATPGLGVIQVTHGGRSGSLKSIVPLTNAWQQAGQAPDAHGIRIRVRR